MNQLIVPSPPMIHTSVKSSNASGHAEEKTLWEMSIPDKRISMLFVIRNDFSFSGAGLHTRAICFSELVTRVSCELYKEVNITQANASYNTSTGCNAFLPVPSLI